MDQYLGFDTPTYNLSLYFYFCSLSVIIVSSTYDTTFVHTLSTAISDLKLVTSLSLFTIVRLGLGVETTMVNVNAIYI